MKNIFGLLIAFISILLSCKKTERLPTEPLKNPEGSWKITKAVRNGTDLTPWVNFSRFRITFQKDGAYSIESNVLFVVNGNGTWSFNDPHHPFALFFHADGSDAAVISQLAYPVVKGRRNIQLTFSPGCTANTYEYTLEQITE